jgi:hypothetical protein
MGTVPGGFQMLSSRRFHIRVENPDVLPHRLAFLDKLPMARRLLIGVVRRVAFKHQHQRHIVIPIVDATIVTRAFAGRKVKHAGMACQIAMAGCDQRMPIFERRFLQGKENDVGQWRGFLDGRWNCLIRTHGGYLFPR